MRTEYKDVFSSVESASKDLNVYLNRLLSGIGRIDRIGTRPKGIKKFYDKCNNVDDSGNKKYSDPINEIQDQIGARVIVFFLSDVQRICTIIEDSFSTIENAVKEPESTSEFAYFGRHYICMLPSEIRGNYIDGYCPPWFEIQIKTMHQHAWSEAGHDVGYKPGKAALSPDDERKMAYASALTWGADRAFNELQESVSLKQQKAANN